MIARRGRDDTVPLLFGIQQQQSIARSSFLETARALKVLELAEDFTTGDLGERN